MWNQGKTLVIITGASRGLGQAIAVQMTENITFPTFVLISRALEDLRTTEKLCKEKNDKSQVILGQKDLNRAKIEDFNEFFDKFVDFKEFESLVLVHNAGSLGNQGTKIVDFDNSDEMQAYWYLNVISVMLLNSAVNKRLKGMKNKLVINISSLAALQPFETWGSYCAGKAARDSLFKNMAVEEGEAWTVLNYAPGPLDTKMIQDLLDDQNTHANIRNAFENMKKSNSLLTPEQSAKRLIEILNKPKGAFKSGDHIDYFDQL